MRSVRSWVLATIVVAGGASMVWSMGMEQSKGLEQRLAALEAKLSGNSFTIEGKGGRITLLAGETSGIWITGPGGSSVPQVAIWRNDKVAALGTYGPVSKFAACASAMTSRGTLQLEAGQDDFRTLRGSDLKKGEP